MTENFSPTSPSRRRAFLRGLAIASTLTAFLSLAAIGAGVVLAGLRGGRWSIDLLEG